MFDRFLNTPLNMFNSIYTEEFLVTMQSYKASHLGVITADMSFSNSIVITNFRRFSFQRKVLQVNFIRFVYICLNSETSKFKCPLNLFHVESYRSPLSLFFSLLFTFSLCYFKWGERRASFLKNVF